MSTPENPSADSAPAPAEATALWEVDDPEKTTHIARPAGTAAPQAPPPAAPAAAYPSGYAAPAPTNAPTPAPAPAPAPVTQPWTPQPGPPTPAPSYHQPQQPNYNPQGSPQPPQGPYPQQPPPYPQGYGYAPAAGDPASPFAPTTPVTPVKKSRRTPILIAAAVAVIAVAAVGVTGFWKPGFFVTRQLDNAKVQEGVQRILTDQTNGYGISGISGLTCNNGTNPSAKKGTKFTCDLTVSGAKHHVEVTVTDDNGTYQVGKVT